MIHQFITKSRLLLALDPYERNHFDAFGQDLQGPDTSTAGLLSPVDDIAS
jgi:hypothetical protein